ncbi:MAG: hypothetical protein AMXMBFR53_20010 [Gemmatimonadota bacterium]
MVGLVRFRAFLARESHATGLPLAWLLAVAVAVHAATAVVAVKPWHPDEHFQILEFAWARAGHAPLDSLPWEFAARIRPALQPVLAMGVLGALRALGVTSPFAWILVLRLATLALALAVLLRVVGRAAPGLDPGPRRVLWLGAFLLWFAPFLLFRFTSENLAGILFAAALVRLDRGGGGDGEGGDVFTGALLGLAFVVRFQMAFAVGAVLAWVVLRTPGGVRRAVVFALAAAGVVGLATLVDAWFYRELVFTPWRYFQVNLLEGTASSFGTSPWYAYLLWAPLWMAPPLGVVVGALVVAGMAARPASPWTWSLVAFLAGHSLVAHKELRFLFPVIYLVPVLAAWGAQRWRQVLFGGWWSRWAAGLLVVQNALLLVVLLTPAVHRGREVDAHYVLWLWRAAEAHPGDTIYVLTDEGSAYRTYPLEANVVRHPRVRAVPHRPGDPVPVEVPRDTPPERLFVLRRGTEPPAVAGAEALPPAYASEAGYRSMARRLGLEGASLLRWLEDVDGWTGSTEARRVYSLRISSGPETAP